MSLVFFWTLFSVVAHGCVWNGSTLAYTVGGRPFYEGGMVAVWEPEEDLSREEEDDGGGGGGSGDGEVAEGGGGYEDDFPEVTYVVPENYRDRQSVPAEETGDCYYVDGDTFRQVCDSPDWDRVDLDQVPDRLESLVLDGTGIGRFGEGSFAGRAVLYLEVSGNHTGTAFDDGAFRGLAATQALVVSGNRWEEPDPAGNCSFFRPFRHLRSLRQLVLEYNGLSVAGVDVRAHLPDRPVLPRLEYLSLEGNQLGSIEKNFFRPLRESPLKELNLKRSHLETISREAFKHLGRLSHVDFYGNRLLMFSNAEMFSSNPRLVYFPAALDTLEDNDQLYAVGMGSMALPAVPYRALESIRSELVYLNLAENNMTSVGIWSRNTPHKVAFPTMPHLEELNLADNRIEEVHPEAFKNLTGLRKLNMRHNRLTTVFDGLVYVPTLEELDLSLQCTDEELFDRCQTTTFKVPSGSFTDAASLRVLNMGKVLLNYVEAGSFLGLTGLEELRLDGTDLLAVDDDALAEMPNLRRLYLNDNYNLVGLSNATFSGLAYLETLDLSYSSKAFTVVNDSEGKGADGPAVRAMSGEEMSKVLDLASLKELDLQCALTENCVGKLDFDAPLDVALLSNLPALQALDLSENSLREWDEDLFSSTPCLRVLNLRTNNILYLKEGMIESFRRLEELDLSDNPVTCDGMVTAFHEMVLDQEGVLEVVGYEGGDGYFCSCENGEGDGACVDGEASFRDFAEDAWHDQRVKGILVGVGVLLLVMLAAAAYFGYRNRFYISYHILRSRRRFKDKRDPDAADFDYDVFICYSKEERGWLLEEFLPELESRDPPVRACVHERDFEVGVAVTDNIVASIDRSRRFLMVLSPGLAASKWCMFEVHLAQSRLVGGPPGSLIVVVKERPAAMGRSLSAIVRNWTYLKWPGAAATAGEREAFYLRLKHSILRPEGESPVVPPPPPRLLATPRMLRWADCSGDGHQS